jgi:hypothetical protein
MSLNIPILSSIEMYRGYARRKKITREIAGALSVLTGVGRVPIQLMGVARGPMQLSMK